jgi:formylglycine-generating enzyme required for sulfatase activity
MSLPRSVPRAAAVLLVACVAACQLVSGIGDLQIVDDGGADGSAQDGAAEGAPPADSTVDGQTEASAPDGDATVDVAPEGAGDAGDGGDATSTTDAADAADSTAVPDATDAADGGGADVTSDASDASDANSAADAGPDVVDAGQEAEAAPGCTQGWQCPTGSCKAGQCTDPPSCQGIGKTCGVGASHDCCESIAVQAGPGVTYLRGFDGIDFTDASAPATISGSFALDRYEVTVERFIAFVSQYSGTPPAAGAGAYPGVPGTGWDPSWNGNLPSSQSALITAITSCPQPFAPPQGLPPQHPHAPINCVDWYVAFAFCAWDGSRLPTEAEWNFVATGGSAQRMYPWSFSGLPRTIDSTFAWYNCSQGTFEDDGGSPTCVGGGPGSEQDVGSASPHGDGLWGHSDLAGSVFEPTLDYFGPFPVPCSNCVNTNAGSGQRVYRGGSFIDPPMPLHTASRAPIGPTFVAPNLGIRCAR